MKWKPESLKNWNNNIETNMFVEEEKAMCCLIRFTQRETNFAIHNKKWQKKEAKKRDDKKWVKKERKSKLIMNSTGFHPGIWNIKFKA